MRIVSVAAALLLLALASSTTTSVAMAASAAVGGEPHFHDHHHHEHHDMPSKHDHGHDCMHDQIKDLPGRGINAPRIPVNYTINTNVDSQGRRSFHASASAYGSIRVQFFFDSGDCSTSGSTSCGHCTAVGQVVPTFYSTPATTTCTSSDVLTTAKKNYIMNVLMPGAVSFYAQALSVIPVSGNLVLSSSSTTCGSPGTPIPSAHRTTGVANADLVIYITAVPTGQVNSQTAAWASSCRYDTNGRPVAAQVNFVPAMLDNADTLSSSATDTDLKIATHELGHALGFSAPWFDSKKGYLALDGITYVKATGLSTVTSSTLGKSVTYLTSPRVAREVQSYFGCTTIPGAEIEDQGGSGTAGSHFEKRVYMQDNMAGIATTAQVFNGRFFLAMMEDTGHYVANYDVADPRYSWGKSKGCSFLTAKCNTLSSTTISSSQEYCFDTSGVGSYCTYDRLARGYCGVSTYTSALPSYFQYFTNPNMGANSQYQDYCPVINYYSNRVCIDSANQATGSQDIYGETYSSGSRCFDSNLISSDFVSTSSSNQVRCFPVSCSAGRLVLSIKGKTVNCPAGGAAGNADVSSLGSAYTGTITCPSASVYGCTTSSAGTLGTTTPAPTVVATPATPSPVTTAPPPVTPAPPTPLECSAGAPSNDAYAPNTCAGYVACDTTYCGCISSTGSDAQACTTNLGSRANCDTLRTCMATYFSCLTNLSSTRSTSDACSTFGNAMQINILGAFATSYAGSSLQTSCRYNTCRLTSNLTSVRGCTWGVNASSVCVDVYATTTSTPTSTPPATTSPSYQVTVEIRISGTAWATVLNDPVQAATLRAGLIKDIATLLNIPAAYINIILLSVGSLVINFGVYSGSGAATSTLLSSVASATASTTWLANAASVYSKVSTESLTVLSATVTATAAPTTTATPNGPGSVTASAAGVSRVVAAATTLVCILAALLL